MAALYIEKTCYFDWTAIWSINCALTALTALRARLTCGLVTTVGVLCVSLC
jgi:hypothetical protein